ncbi:MAG: DUF3786 domain-containing protein [Eubacteriales bacterium]|nr:DUF3786 domain-containing protein [Eubacteriales bacterium]
MTQAASNNYERLCLDWQKRILTLDPEELLKKLPELREENGLFVLSHFGSLYGVRRDTGEIVSLDPDRSLSMNARLNIYTLLWYCSPDARFLGDWVPFRSLKDASPFAPAFQRGDIDVFSQTFSGHIKLLKSACEKLGGTPIPHSDAGYELHAFACIPVRFLFWDGDDEFPAQSNILFDRGATGFIHVESMVSIASEGIARLAEAAGLPMSGHSY